ncbi:MAG TPA: glycosyltransferase [Flavobacteriales bacterium]|nr:glycosyltransferase [Flavobacteriales bacterium]HRE96035.1 glycosyltransferase [Flavobacteriales bacterium]HRJ36649.1 glycosyltransferase [Flavobacteriales bacterium]HRJ39621.1 glycosyltransferase [Flavobacteriales bacterium]
MKKPRVSVIICTHNREMYLNRAMECVALQNADSSLFELIVVNNNSTDSTDSICKEFRARYTNLNFSYIIEMEQGLSHARNRGIKEAKGDLIVFLDDDAFAEPDFVKNLIAFYDLHPPVLSTGGKTVPLFEEEKPAWMSRFLLPLVAAMDLGPEARLFPKGWYPIGANMSFRKAAVELIGNFDVLLGRKGKNLQGGEEKDFFNRLKSKGHEPWYLPTTEVRHIIPASRMSINYIRRQARGIGYSERVRTKSLGLFSYWGKCFSEKMKWIASIVLFLFYLITLRAQKAVFLLRFRFWVSQGLFFGRE